MKLEFDVVAHRRQRLPGAGDWFKYNGVWYFRISRLKDKRYVWLVFLHEVTEWAICQLKGITTKQVDDFDKGYEAARGKGVDTAPCGCKFLDEPGEDVHSPYHEAHQVATQCEMLIAKCVGVDWFDYNTTVANL